MALDDRVKAAATGLIQSARHTKDMEVRKLLRTEQGKAAARGILGAGFYAAAQDELCAAEMKQRGAQWLAIGIRIATELEMQWTEEFGRDFGFILKQELETDFNSLYDELARVTPGAQGVSGHLSTAKERARTSIDQEVSLLVLKHDRLKVPLVEQLRNARYAAAAAAWKKSDAFMKAIPPDLEKGVSEAVSSVEAVARLVVADPKATLGGCVKVLRSRGVIESPLLKGFEELWGFSSEAENVRHGGGEGPQLKPESARYLISVAAAALELLLARDVT
jgi:hypothetical protein